jgi:hypothetical protein
MSGFDEAQMDMPGAVDNSHLQHWIYARGGEMSRRMHPLIPLIPAYPPSNACDTCGGKSVLKADVAG